MSSLSQLKQLQDENIFLKKQLIQAESKIQTLESSKYHRFRKYVHLSKQVVRLLPLLIKETLRSKKSLNKFSIPAPQVVQNKSKKPQLRVLYDFQAFSSQKVGGISRLFHELIKNISASNYFSANLALGKMPDNIYLKRAKYLDQINPTVHPNSTPTSLPLNNPVIRRLYQLLNVHQDNFSDTSNWMDPRNYFNDYDVHLPIANALINSKSYDVFHPTYFDTYFLPLLKAKPFILTVYDMIPEMFPQYSPPGDIIARNKKLLVHRAAHIIAISQNTKNDLVKILNVDPAKISVVHLASSLNTKKNKQLTKKNNFGEYLLYVGTRVNYKNFDEYVTAIAPILHQNPKLKIVCVGDKPASGPFTDQEISLFKKLRIRQQLVFTHATDEELVGLYSQAKAFIFPSLYEGFGIPVLEAFSCFCPVMCSNTSSLPEVAGNAAVYFDPYSKASMRDSLQNFLKGGVRLRNELIFKGQKQLKSFTWDNSAKKTMAVYKLVATKHAS